MAAPDAIQSEDVGGFAMTVASTEVSDDAAYRWSRRGERLAAWLLAEWRREQARRIRREENHLQQTES